MNAAIRFLADLRFFSVGRDPHALFDERLTFGEKLADRVAAVGGSWGSSSASACSSAPGRC